MSVYAYMCMHICVYGCADLHVHQGQKKASNPSELKLQVFVWVLDCYMGSSIQISILVVMQPTKPSLYSFYEESFKSISNILIQLLLLFADWVT